MNRVRFLFFCLAAVVLGFTCSNLRATAGQTPVSANYSNVVRLAGDLHRALDPQERQRVDAFPWVRDEGGPAAARQTGSLPLSSPGRLVLSPEFLALMEQLAQAMAMDQREPGYFDRYLAGHSTAPGLTTYPNLNSLEMENGRLSNFNQLTGTLLAIEMAHHYLGHYKKYATQLASQPGAPIATFISTTEWRDAVKKGAHNALACGLGPEAFDNLLAAMERQALRPAWSKQFIPPDANLTKVRKDLERVESYFFAERRWR